MSDDTINEPKETPPPGDYIRAELKRRGWGQDDLARILDRPTSRVNELIQGKLTLSPELAIALAAALGGTAEKWLEREAGYRLALAKDIDDETVRKRAGLYELALLRRFKNAAGFSRPMMRTDWKRS